MEIRNAQFTLNILGVNNAVSFTSGGVSYSIPLDPANRHYQEVLDAIIAEGAACFDGDIPAELQTAADTKQSNQQLAAYRTATARLAQYIVSVGRTEVVESQATGEQVFDEDTMEMVDVMHDVITVTAVEAVEATVTRTVYSDDMDAEPTEETIENPVITVDVAERAEAQATVDGTPEAVVAAA
jgi:DNA-binding FrmR family transcriptional regulator|tara:strand:- start:1002 stop:1553 length:552 start_codon:yes stop_codon:yes gene_type:complete